MKFIDIISEWAINNKVNCYAPTDSENIIDKWVSDSSKVYGLLYVWGPSISFWTIFEDSIRFPDGSLVSAADPELFKKIENSIKAKTEAK